MFPYWYDHMVWLALANTYDANHREIRLMTCTSFSKLMFWAAVHYINPHTFLQMLLLLSGTVFFQGSSRLS